MPVIAMTREMGSLGNEVAEGLAKDLGLRLVYHEVVDSVAEKMHMPQSAVMRYLQGKANVLERLRVDMDGLSLFTAEEVFELATGGNLMIRGWGATYLLRPVSHALCIRICSPIELRAQRMRERLGIDDVALVFDEIRRNDVAHTVAMQRRFGIAWEDSGLYDVVLNTGRFSVEECIHVIKHLLTLEAFQETPASRAQLEKLLTCARIHTALRTNPGTSHIRITVDTTETVAGRGLVLKGIVQHSDDKRLAELVATRVAGAGSITNNLKLMRTRYLPKDER